MARDPQRQNGAVVRDVRAEPGQALVVVFTSTLPRVALE